MSRDRLEPPNTDGRPSRKGKAAQNKSSIRSPSPYHHLDLFDTEPPFEEPLISFEDDSTRKVANVNCIWVFWSVVFKTDKY